MAEAVYLNEGRSAYEIWLAQGNTGTEADFLEAMRGNSGYQGAAGELEVVNNLNQGGAAKALSAEMGKKLNQDKADKDLENLSAAGKAKFDAKANKNGYYGQMSVGAAENLIGHGSVNTLYNHRASGGTEDIGTGAANIEKIKGNTIAWNQLIYNGDFSSDEWTYGWTRSSGVFTKTETGVRIEKVSNSSGASLSRNIYSSKYFVLDHKYLFVVDVRDLKVSGQSAYLYVGFGRSNMTLGYSRSYSEPGLKKFITTLVETNRDNIGVRLGMSGTDNGSYAVIGSIMCCDLTEMFGAGNEPLTVADFEALFPLDYYSYKETVLVNNKAKGIRTTGFNQYDRSRPLFRCLPRQYEIVGAYTGVWFGTDASRIDEPMEVTDGKFTPRQDGFIRVEGGDGTTCVHLVWTGYRDGEFEEYAESTMYFVADGLHDLSDVTGKRDGEGVSERVFPDGLRSVGNVRDEMDGASAVRRIGSQLVTGAIGDTVELAGCDLSATEIRCAYDIGTLSGGVLTLAENAEASVVYYPLATPEHYVLDAPLNMNYSVDDFGTEERLPVDTRDMVQAPILYEVKYAMNAVDFIRRAPENFISKASFDNFASELATKLGAALDSTIDIQATYDDVDAEYDFDISITPNDEQQ